MRKCWDGGTRWNGEDKWRTQGPAVNTQVSFLNETQKKLFMMERQEVWSERTEKINKKINYKHLNTRYHKLKLKPWVLCFLSFSSPWLRHPKELIVFRLVLSYTSEFLILPWNRPYFYSRLSQTQTCRTQDLIKEQSKQTKKLCIVFLISVSIVVKQ